jgi:hypothetical protein
MKKLIWMILACSVMNYAQAKTIYTGEDLSGVYDCTGDDAKEGKYKATATLNLKPEQSTGIYASYDFKLSVQGFGVYLGEAVAQGDNVAMHFGLNELNTKDIGTGIAKFKRNSQGKQTFHKFYYEPEYKGGNYGFEDCVQR